MWTVSYTHLDVYKRQVSLFVIRLDGRPRLAMACSLISAGINVVLDWVFIFPLGWGVKGAAIATSISVVIGGLIAVGYLLLYARFLRLYPIKWSHKSIRLFIRNIGYQCRIGSSALLAEATLATLMFMGNHLFMHYLGEHGVGAFGIACYYTPFVFMVGNAIAQSAQPIISYNFGAGCRQRVQKTIRIALLLSLIHILWSLLLRLSSMMRSWLSKVCTPSWIKDINRRVRPLSMR